MKLSQIQEAKYASPSRLHLTGIFYTGTEGQYAEQNVTITVTVGRTTSRGYDEKPRIISSMCKVEAIRGGEIAETLVIPNATARYDREPEGWSLKGFTNSTDKRKYGDTWVLYDPSFPRENSSARIEKFFVQSL